MPWSARSAPCPAPAGADGPRRWAGGRPARPAGQPRPAPCRGWACSCVGVTLRAAVPRLRVGGAARQGGGDERAVADGVVRCASSGSSRTGTCRRCSASRVHRRHRGHPADPDAGAGVRAVDGLRGVPALPDPRGSGTATGDNTLAVAGGLQRAGASSRAPPVLLVVVIGAFATSGIVFIKMIGVGMVDRDRRRRDDRPGAARARPPCACSASWNWWAPAPLARFWARHGIREPDDLPEPVGATDGPPAGHREREHAGHWTV